MSGRNGFSTSSWIQPDPQATLVQISAGFGDQIWGVNANGQVEEFNGTELLPRRLLSKDTRKTNENAA